MRYSANYQLVEAIERYSDLSLSNDVCSGGSEPIVNRPHCVVSPERLFAHRLISHLPMES
jgi:hypothetical protein